MRRAPLRKVRKTTSPLCTAVSVSRSWRPFLLIQCFVYPDGGVSERGSSAERRDVRVEIIIIIM